MLEEISKLLNGRVLAEALGKLEKCQNCSNFTGQDCKIMTHAKYVHTLARGYCKLWDEDKPDTFIYSSPNDTRIKIVLYTYALLCGGAERWLVDLAIGLDKKKFNVCVAINKPTLIDQMLFEKLRTCENLRFGWDHSLAVMDSADIVLSWASFIRCYAKHTIFCSHGCDKYAQDLVKTNPILTRYKFTAVSKRAAEPWLNHAGKAGVTILYNGSDPARLIPTKTRAEARAELGISDETILIGFISRMTPGKHPEKVVKAAKEIPNAKALFVCDKVPSAKFPNCIYLPRTEELGNIFVALDCFMLPSDSEAFSLAIIEAWLAGVPVATTPVGAVPELEEQFGKLVARIRPDNKISESVLEAIADKEMVSRAKRIAESHFTTTAMVKRWEDYLCKV